MGEDDCSKRSNDGCSPISLDSAAAVEQEAPAAAVDNEEEEATALQAQPNLEEPVGVMDAQFKAQINAVSTKEQPKEHHDIPLTKMENGFLEAQQQADTFDQNYKERIRGYTTDEDQDPSQEDMIIGALSMDGPSNFKRKSDTTSKARNNREDGLAHHHLTECMASPVPLARYSHSLSVPGAYRRGPTADMDGDLAEINEIHDYDVAAFVGGGTTVATTTRNHEGLVEANLVNEEEEGRSDMMEAQPVEVEKKAKEAGHVRTKCMMGKIALVIALLLALVLGLAIGLRRNSVPQKSQTPTTPAPPLEQPEVLDDLMRILPKHTLDSLIDPDSIQSKAFQWLSNHQNITHIAEWRKVQLFALACYFYGFDGPNWPFGLNKAWLDDHTSECSWYSRFQGIIEGSSSVLFDIIYGGLDEEPMKVTVCSEKGEFQILEFRGKKSKTAISQRDIPLEMALLTSLKFIRIHEYEVVNVSLADVFPADLAPLMSNLDVLKLDRNVFYGIDEIPTQFGLMKNLKGLQLTMNEIYGHVPIQLGLLTNLEQLMLMRNYLNGMLPIEWYHSLTNLKVLELHQNDFLPSPLPSELGLMTSLQGLGLQQTSFYGTIPTEIGLLTNLRRCRLGKNSFSGPIPSEFGLLTSLRVLEIKDNPHLSGSLPTQFGQLTSLVTLDLSNSNLSGSVPTGLGLLPTRHNLGFLDISKNNFTGEIPPDLCTLDAASCSYIDPLGRDEENQEGCALEFDCGMQLCGCNCNCLEG